MRQWQCGSVQKGNFCCGKDNTKTGEWKRTCHLARVYWHLGSPRSVGTPREIERSLGPRNAPSSPWKNIYVVKCNDFLAKFAITSRSRMESKFSIASLVSIIANTCQEMKNTSLISFCSLWRNHWPALLLPPQLEPLSGPMIAYHVARTWNQLCKTKTNRNKNSNTRIFQQPTLLHKSLSVFFSADHWSNNATSPGVQGATVQSASRENHLNLDNKWSDLMSAGVLSATLTIGKQVGNFSRRWTHSNAVLSSKRPGHQNV